MDNSYEIREGYLFVRVAGEFDLPAAQQATLDWVDQARKLAISKAIVDITGVKGFDRVQVATLTRFTLGTFAVASIPEGFQLAVLETPAQMQDTGFDEAVMLHRGVNVRVTINLQDALAWLNVPDGAIPLA